MSCGLTYLPLRVKELMQPRNVSVIGIPADDGVPPTNILSTVIALLGIDVDAVISPSMSNNILQGNDLLIPVHYYASVSYINVSAEDENTKVTVCMILLFNPDISDRRTKLSSKSTLSFV